jgi:hypothetical protein
MEDSEKNRAILLDKRRTEMRREIRRAKAEGNLSWQSFLRPIEMEVRLVTRASAITRLIPLRCQTEEHILSVFILNSRIFLAREIDDASSSIARTVKQKNAEETETKITVYKAIGLESAEEIIQSSSAGRNGHAICGSALAEQYHRPHPAIDHLVAG